MLNSIELADRQIRAAVREDRALSRKLCTITKLEHPIQKGWRRFYTLSDHARTRRDQPTLEAILRVIGSVVVHHSIDFRRRRGRRKRLVEIEQPLRPIPVYEWARKKYPFEWLAYFRWELQLHWSRHWQPYWVFRQPSLYRLKIERNWLWYFREVDPTVETRLSELDRWLNARLGWQRYGWLKGKSQGRRWEPKITEKEKSLRREHQREIKRALGNFPDVDLNAPTWCIQASGWKKSRSSPDYSAFPGSEVWVTSAKFVRISRFDSCRLHLAGARLSPAVFLRESLLPLCGSKIGVPS
jgi:hypothetical protein